MKTLLAILLFTFLIHPAKSETFRSHSIIMMTKDSADIVTKKLFWWTDWSVILPADGTHRVVELKKRSMIVGNEVYTFEGLPKRGMAYFKNRSGAVFCHKAKDQSGKEWTVTVLRDNLRILFIQIENENKVIVYQ